MLRTLLLLSASVGSISCHGVATSSQSMVSGEGWRYSYGIAHGPHGVGHAVGESFPHGYGGFGTYAPGFGYNLVPPPHLPPHPVVVKLPPQFVLPLPPTKPFVFPKPIEIVRPIPYVKPVPYVAQPYVKPVPYVAQPYVKPLPYIYAPYQPHHLHNYVYLDEHDHEHLPEHLHEPGHFGNYADLFDHHHR